jgi:hypothetical protein
METLPCFDTYQTYVKVLRLRKSLYVLKKYLRASFDRFCHVTCGMGYT